MSGEILRKTEELCVGWLDFSGWDAAAEETSAAALSVSRMERIASISNARARRQSIAAGVLLEEMLRDAGVPEPYQYVRSQRGKPCLSEVSGKAPFISITHAQTAAACAVSFHHPVGIDLEAADRFCVSRAYDRLIASRLFSDAVRKRLQDAHDDGRLLLHLWTAAEATAKAKDISLFDVLPRMDIAEGTSEEIVRLVRSDESVRLSFFYPGNQICCLCLDESSDGPSALSGT